MRFYVLEKLINLHEGYRKLIKIDEHNMLLVQSEGKLFLIESSCPHRGHPLSESDIVGNRLRCPLHGYLFNLDNGALVKSTEEPCRNLRTYEPVYQGTEVGVML